MDIWRYYDVTHARHRVCNPIDAATIDELGEVLALCPGMRVLDVACGFGEFLVRWVERHGIAGVGVDLSPFAIPRAEARARERVPDADLRFVECDGKDFTDPDRFDVAMCLGATWIWTDRRGTLEALRGFADTVVVAEPFWTAEPPQEYLDAERMTRDRFATLEESRRAPGLELCWLATSPRQEWDRYEMLQTLAVQRFAAEHADDPDLEEIRALRAKHEETYFRWERRCFGYALWVFQAAS